MPGKPKLKRVGFVPGTRSLDKKLGIQKEILQGTKAALKKIKVFPPYERVSETEFKKPGRRHFDRDGDPYDQRFENQEITHKNRRKKKGKDRRKK